MPEYTINDIFDPTSVNYNGALVFDNVPAFVNQFSEGVGANAFIPGSEVGGDIQSAGFEDVNGWKLEPNGNATFAGELNVGSLFFSKQFVFSFFESADGWITAGTTGTITQSIGGTSLQTTNIADRECFISNVETGAIKMDGDKNPTFTASVRFGNSIANMRSFIYSGYMIGKTDGTPGVGGDGTENGFGFRIEDGVLYASTTTPNEGAGISDETSTDITGTLSIVNTLHIFKAIMKTGQIEFYVDNVLVATHTGLTNSDFDSDTSMFFHIETKENVNKTTILQFVSFQQDI